MTREIRGTSGIVSLLVLLTGALGALPDETQAKLSPEKSGLRCRNAAARSVRFLTETGLRLVDSCIRKAGATPPPAECAVLDDSVGTPYGRASARVQAKLQFMCQRDPDNPARANYPGGDSFTILPAVKAILEESARATVATATAFSQGQPASARRCTRAICTAGSNVILSTLDEATGCQKRLDRRGNPLGPLSSSCAQANGRASRRADSVIERRCSDAVEQGLPAGTCAPFPGCETSADITTGERLAATTYSLAEETKQPSVCGDGVVDEDRMENCDDGNLVATDACTDTCRLAGCQDGIVWEGNEACDDANEIDDDCCSNDCKSVARCGDGVVQTGCREEECDDPTDPGCRDCKFVPFTCDGSGLIATVAVRYDLASGISIPGDGIAGVKVRVDFPTSLAIQTLEGTPLVDPSRQRNLGDPTATFLSATGDANGNGLVDITALWAKAGKPGFDPAKDLFEFQFECPSGTAVFTKDLTCAVLEAVDVFGNSLSEDTLLLQRSIPCKISSTRLVSAGS